MTGNLYKLFQDRFPADRSRTFLESDAGRICSYADLEAASGRFARLLQNLGAQPGDRLALQVEKSPEALFLYLACLRAGVILLPLNTAYKPKEVAYFLGDAEPRILVCDPAREAELRPHAEAAGVAHLLTLNGAGQGTVVARSAGLDPDVGITPRAADDIAAILYTSGTTGRSKGAMLSHDNLGSNAQVLHEAWGFRPGDVLLHALPIFHTHGLFVATNSVLLNGGSMLFLPRFDAQKAIALLPRATVMMGVPTFYVRLLEEPGFTRELCAHMRLFIAGSAPLLEETFLAFEARTGQRILERYGMTEASMIASNPLAGERKPGTVGRSLPGVAARIADEAGKALSPGEVGVLEIKGRNVFKGYWRNPEKTAQEFRPDGYFITGDMARMDADGVIQIVGRAKDLIISGGFNVYPKEVELAVDALSGVAESAVIGLPHPDFGEAVAAVVVTDGSVELSEAGVIAALKDELANFKVPKRVFFTAELPRNSMGKVQKKALREEIEG